MNLHDILGNQVFAGVAGAGLLTGALVYLRQVPGRLWTILCSEFSATLTVYSEQEAFRNIDLWLGRHPSAKNSRRIALTERWEAGAHAAEFEFTPGEGPHLLWEGGRPVFVFRNIEPAAPGNYGARKQHVTITTFGRSRAMLQRILAECRGVQDRDVVPVHLWRGHGFELIERRSRRPLETIFLGADLRDRIVADARRFVERKAWYVDRALPHRRGYLFHGAPGTGKSSMALALAGELGRPIYIINPSTVSDDNELQGAINQAGGAVVLIEDIDALSASKARVKAKPQPPPLMRRAAAVSASPAQETSGITMSGLLNAIDGVAARDGRILIITTNHPEQLDPALIRPGRIDMRCEFEAAGHAEAEAMFRRFCPETDPAQFMAEIANALPLAQADLQNRLLELAA